MENMVRQKKNRGETVHIVLALVAILVVAGAIAAVLIIRNNRKYSVGEADGNSYRNKWANVKVYVPDDYVVSTKQQKVSGFDNPFSFATKNGKGYCYVFTREGKPDMGNMEEEFKKTFGDGMFNMAYGKVGMQVNMSTDHRTIAGESYDCLVMTVAGVRMTLAFRPVHDNGVFCVCTVTLNGESEDDMFRLFEKY